MNPFMMVSSLWTRHHPKAPTTNTTTLGISVSTYDCGQGHKHSFHSTTQVSTDEWMDKLRSICIMEYCLTIQRNWVLTHATIWMYLKITMPGWEKPDTRGHIVYSIYIKISKVGKSLERQNIYWWLPGAWGGRIGSNCLIGMGFPFGMMEIFWN